MVAEHLVKTLYFCCRTCRFLADMAARKKSKSHVHNEEDINEIPLEDINIDKLIGPGVTFNFEPQTDAIKPVDWQFVRQSECPPDNWNEAFVKQSTEESSVSWSFQHQLESHPALLHKWKFSKVMPSHCDIPWKFISQCPSSGTIKWQFKNHECDVGKIGWTFDDQIDGLAPLSWQFNSQSSGSNVPWKFSKQSANASDINWDFSKQCNETAINKWKFGHQLQPSGTVPWRFKAQLLEGTPLQWKFDNQTNCDRHVNWQFTQQSAGDCSVPWRFNQCLAKAIHQSQLKWNFDHCLAADSDTLHWQFQHQMSSIRQVNWTNLPRMTDSLCNSAPTSYDEIMKENVAFKEKYLAGCGNPKLKKVVATTNRKPR